MNIVTMKILLATKEYMTDSEDSLPPYDTSEVVVECDGADEKRPLLSNATSLPHQNKTTKYQDKLRTCKFYRLAVEWFWFTLLPGIIALAFLLIPLTSPATFSDDTAPYWIVVNETTCTIFFFVWTMLFAYQFFTAGRQTRKLYKQSQLQGDALIAFVIANYQMFYAWHHAFLSLNDESLQSFVYYVTLTLTTAVPSYLLDVNLDTGKKTSVSSWVYSLSMLICGLHLGMFFQEYQLLTENVEDFVLPLCNALVLLSIGGLYYDDKHKPKHAQTSSYKRGTAFTIYALVLVGSGIVFGQALSLGASLILS